MVQSINQYIRYHSEPCSGFVSIKEWNEQFGTNLEENEELEYKIMKLRSELGHNEFIPTISLLKFARKVKEKSAKSIKSSIDNKTSIYKKNYMKRWGKTLGGALHVGYAARKWKKYKAKREAKKQDQLDEPADVEQPEVEEEKQQEEEQVEDLDDLLQAEPEYDEEEYEEPEAEYEEACHQKCPSGQKEVKHYNSGPRGCKPETVSAPVVKSEEGDEGAEDADASFQQAVDELEISDAQALNHLIAFKGETDDVRTRVMKGKARYIEKLTAYAKGDDEAEVRMYNGVKVKIADLNPNKKSLLQALQAFPSGPHFIECD